MAEEIGPNETHKKYVCAGYYLSKVLEARCRSVSIHSPIITISTCLADTLPGPWAFTWIKMNEEERNRAAERCGLASRLRDFMEWTTQRATGGTIRYPNVLSSIELAHELLDHFRIDTKNWRLLGLGLKGALVERFIEEYKPRRKGEWTNGIFDLLTLRRALDPRGQLLGYDVLGVEAAGTVHSWLCNSVEELVAEKFSICPDSTGLLKTYSDAETVATYLSDPETGAEPVPWHPWALAQYML